MKSKKLLPVIIIAVAVLAMAVCSIISGIAYKPTVTEGEFPFSITYELNGETVTVEDVLSVRYDRNDGYTDTKSRIYIGVIDGIGEENVFHYELENGSFILNTKLYADYLMGDTEYDYFDDEEFAPQMLYYDAEGTEYTDEETLAAHGMKLVSYEYPTPIENSFVFSHISILNNTVILPTLVIGLLALIATVIFVKKDDNYVKKPISVVSTIFNFLFCLTFVPFFALIIWISDVIGDNAGVLNQMLYFIPAFELLCVTASVALRRKNCAVIGFLVQFAGPALLSVISLISNIFAI